MHMNTRRTRLVFAGAAALLTLAACGTSDGDTSAGGSWCDFVDESDVVDDILESLGTGSEGLEDGLNQVEKFTERLADEAPSEIADDAKVVAENTQRLVDALRDADFEVLDADLSFLGDAEVQARLDTATDGLEEYTEAECGRTFSADGETVPDEAPADGESGDDSGDADFDPASGTIREQIVGQLETLGLTSVESECIANNLDFSDPAIQSGDFQAMLGVFEICDIGLERLAEIGG
jgi:hypothetical protein